MASEWPWKLNSQKYSLYTFYPWDPNFGQFSVPLFDEPTKIENPKLKFDNSIEKILLEEYAWIFGSESVTSI